jgi:radical SAM protein with 4Fe4S-binding SPASM domain
VYPGKANQILLSPFYLRQMNWLINKLLNLIGTQKFLSVQLDITNACNLNCRHCYQGVHSSGGDLSFEDWCGILDQYGELAAKLHLKPHFCISGGEPTLSPIFEKLLREIHSRWPLAGIAVLTNGTNISDHVASLLTAHKADVQISLEGPDAERNDFVRGNGSFARAIEGFRKVQAEGLNVTFQAVLSNRTGAWIAEFFELAAKQNAAAMNFTRFVPQGQGKAFSETGGDQPLLGQWLRDAYGTILADSKKTGVPTGTNLPLFVLISPELGAHGKFGFQGLVVDYKGNLKVTSRADFRLGNVLKGGLEELFMRHPLMEDLRAARIEECGTCDFYDRCGGDRNASYAAYGSFSKKDPGCWL